MLKSIMSRVVDNPLGNGFRMDTGLAEVPYHMSGSGVPTREQFENLGRRLDEILSTKEGKNELHKILRTPKYGNMYRDYLGREFHWVRVIPDCF